MNNMPVAGIHDCAQPANSSVDARAATRRNVTIWSRYKRPFKRLYCKHAAEIKAPTVTSNYICILLILSSLNVLHQMMTVDILQSPEILGIDFFRHDSVETLLVKLRER